LLFETYRVPAVATGIDAVFSAQYNSNGQLPEHGIVLSSSHSASHVLPIVDGKVDFAQVPPIRLWSRYCPHPCLTLPQAKRLDVGGSSMTDFMMQILHLQHPSLRGYVTPVQANELKHRFCFLSGMGQYAQVITVQPLQCPLFPCI
jgi:actin-related protein 5